VHARAFGENPTYATTDGRVRRFRGFGSRRSVSKGNRCRARSRAGSTAPAQGIFATEEGRALYFGRGADATACLTRIDAVAFRFLLEPVLRLRISYERLERLRLLAISATLFVCAKRSRPLPAKKRRQGTREARC